MDYLIVFLGAGIGGVFRHGVNVGAARLLGFGFPLGTMTVNILGSVLMGVLTNSSSFDQACRRSCACFRRRTCSAASRRFRHSRSTPSRSGSAANGALLPDTSPSRSSCRWGGLFAGLMLMRFTGQEQAT